MNRDNPIMSPSSSLAERAADQSLRPRRMDEFIGQDKLKANLSIFLKAAIGREETLDHLLLYGPPGLGKTTIAHIVAAEMGAPIHITSGPAIEKPGDLVGIMTNLEPGAVLFIDEIHRLNRVAEEYLYPAMEDRRVDLVIGKGPAATSVKIDLPPFTVIGATTRQGLLTGPLRDRFGIVLNFEFYESSALFDIVTRSSRILGYPIETGGAEEIARRSRGTPRIANRLLRRVRDFAQVDELDVIGPAIADKALSMLEVDHRGLDRTDRVVLKTIIEKYSGGPVGVDTIAASIGEDSGTIEDVYEPFLMQQGFIQRTPRGRCATKSAYEHLGIPAPKKKADSTLFDGS